MSKKKAKGREVIILEEEPETMEGSSDLETCTMLNGEPAKAAYRERKGELKTAKSRVEIFEEEKKKIIAEMEEHDCLLESEDLMSDDYFSEYEDLMSDDYFSEYEKIFRDDYVWEMWCDHGYALVGSPRLWREVFYELAEKLAADEKKAKIISPKKTFADLLDERIDVYEYASPQEGVNYSIIMQREIICAFIAIIREWRNDD
jgi:hypothetical protein